MTDENLAKLCECGCGNATSIAVRTDRKHGHVKGQPLRYLRGHRSSRTIPLADRFWPKVDKRGSDECWPWRGAKSKSGYGIVRVGGKRRRVHRLAYAFVNGPIPEGMHVLHRCDNPPCCNPNHLFLGTHAENMADMAKKGRQRGPKGENHHKAKLTTADVRTIREWYPAGWTQRNLAAAFGVSQTIIGRIVRRDIWKEA